MGHTNSPFPAVCERCIPIWYYIYYACKKLMVLHLLCRAPWVAQTVQKLRLWQRRSLRIFSLCGCLFEFLSMPPWNLPLSHCERVYLPGAEGARLWVVSLEWVSTRGPFFFFHQTRMCAHIWANPLISPPGLLSISDGSRAVGDDGCWQDLDYWGEDDGSSCSDRIAVTWDPLEGLIRLLWKPLLLDLQQPGRYSEERAHAVFLQLPLPQPIFLFLSKHTHAQWQTTPYLRFSFNTAWSLWSVQKERLHHMRALIRSSGLYLMDTHATEVWTDTNTCYQDDNGWGGEQHFCPA